MAPGRGIWCSRHGATRHTGNGSVPLPGDGTTASGHTWANAAGSETDLHPVPTREITDRLDSSIRAVADPGDIQAAPGRRTGMSHDELTTESTVYVTYIAATPERVWDALTSAEFTQQYFFGRSVESEWMPGAPWRMCRADGVVDVTGVVRACDPPRRLELSWLVDGPPEFRNLPESIVTYEIEPAGEGVVRLTMTEAHPTPIPAVLLAGGRRGWPMILSGLKSLLETGRPLRFPVPQPPRSG